MTPKRVLLTLRDAFLHRRRRGRQSSPCTRQRRTRMLTSPRECGRCRAPARRGTRRRASTWQEGGEEVEGLRTANERSGERREDSEGTGRSSDLFERVLHAPEVVVVARESPETRTEMRERGHEYCWRGRKNHSGRFRGTFRWLLMRCRAAGGESGWK